jgi:hypothetical protein
MMKNSKNQSGFGHLVLVLCLALVVGVVGFAGYRVMNNTDNEVSSTTAKTAETEAPATIESNDDLVQAQKAVDTSDIDSDLDTSALDQDIDALF